MIIPIIILASLIIFTIISLSPGDPAQIIAGDQATEEQIEAIRQRLGLYDFFLVQYFNWLTTLIFNIFNPNAAFGTDWSTAENTVWSDISARIPVTLQLGLASILISNLIAIPTGVVTAVKRGTWIDSLGLGIALLGVSMPNFWLGYILLSQLAIGNDAFPIFYDASKALWWVLPAIALGTGSAATVTRMSRSTLIDTFSQDFIKTARAKGLSERKVIWKHALQNSMLPVITVIGLQAGFIIAGAALTETVFTIPGIGSAMVTSINNKNAPGTLGISVMIIFFITVANTIVDIAYSFIDPRIQSVAAKKPPKSNKKSMTTYIEDDEMEVEVKT